VIWRELNVGDRICAIHQPNFFPWMGYFDKIKHADVFVFLDAVAYPKSGSSMGSWVNRVQIDIQGNPAWIRCPVRRKSGVQLINDVRIDDDRAWREKLLKTISLNYKRASKFDSVMPLIIELIEYPSDRLVEFNINAIKTISTCLGLRCQFVRQSELSVTGNATGLLASITKAVGSRVYLAGGGAAGYQDDDLFAARDVDVRYQNFVPRPYGEISRWIEGLSVIDFMMRQGTTE